MRRLLFYTLILVLCITFRGCLYRASVKYEPTGKRDISSIAGPKLRAHIDGTDDPGIRDVHDVISLALSITSSKLSFTTDKVSVDPEILIGNSDAHCVGYAAFFASTCNYLLEKHGITDWRAQVSMGQLIVFGMNIHQYISDPFFKDHDFAIITNSDTGEKLAVDPTLHDYLRIDHVQMSGAK